VLAPNAGLPPEISFCAGKLVFQPNAANPSATPLEKIIEPLIEKTRPYIALPQTLPSYMDNADRQVEKTERAGGRSWLKARSRMSASLADSAGRLPACRTRLERAGSPPAESG
jgi:hypothetical protein